MKWFFLSSDSYVKLLLVTLVVLNLLPWYLSLFWLCFLAAFFLLFRKNKAFYKDNFSLNPDLMLSPVTGKVLSVQKYEDEDGKEVAVIRALLPLAGPFGLFLPFDSLVEKVEVKGGRPFLRWRRVARFTNGLNRYNVTLRSNSGESVQIELIKGRLGFEPRLYVEPGDKGRALACFGYVPMGGSLNIKLSPKAKLMVAAGDKLRAGETAIAGF